MKSHYQMVKLMSSFILKVHQAGTTTEQAFVYYIDNKAFFV